MIDDLEISALAGGLFGFAVYLIMLRVNRDLWWLCFVAGAGLFAILAAYLLGDWKDCISEIDRVSCRAKSPAPVVQCMFEQLLAYARRHQAVFGDETAAQGFAGSFSRYHGLLRAQLAAPLRKFCRDEFTAEFVAESVLTWSMAGKSFDDIYGMINKLF
jgi:hypothetical protein